VSFYVERPVYRCPRGISEQGNASCMAIMLVCMLAGFYSC
jgi:hypothetical protein